MAMEIRRIEDCIRFAEAKLSKNVLFDSPHFFCDVYCLRPGQEQKAHDHHGADKVYYALEGTVLVRVGDEEQDLVAGHAVIARSGQVHGVRNVSGENAVLFVVMAPRPAR
jgi:mannose-6-phosphate isomerase-like protein (cupin superfamily)